eukprot:2496976-Pleurochrysis_carterae.AAC.5
MRVRACACVRVCVCVRVRARACLRGESLDAERHRRLPLYVRAHATRGPSEALKPCQRHVTRVCRARLVAQTLQLLTQARQLLLSPTKRADSRADLLVRLDVRVQNQRRETVENLPERHIKKFLREGRASQRLGHAFAGPPWTPGRQNTF